MSNLHEPQIVNILGHSAGAVIFGIFLYLVLRDRAGTRLRGSWLSVAAAALAFLWNTGSLVALVSSANNSRYTNVIVFFSFSALSLLPAILLQLSLEGSMRHLIGLGYAISFVAVGMQLMELFVPGRLYQQHALLLITVGFAILTILAAIGILLSGPPTARARAHRVFGAMCSCLLAISFVHFSSGHSLHAWSSELIVHHAGIPLALFVLLQDYRFVLLDAFVRFLANALVAAVLTFIAIRATLPWIVVDDRLSDNPMNQGMLLLSLCVLLISFAVARGQIQRWLTKVVFRRPDLDTALQAIESKGAVFARESEFVTWAVAYLAEFLRTDRVVMVPGNHLIQVPGVGNLMFPVPASDLPALRHVMEFGWAEAIVPLPGAGADASYLLLGRRQGGRRYLSEDLRALSRLAAALFAQVERCRNSELQRLASEAELRALQAQINPHFLFNALNALYGIIPRDAAGARKTVLNLSDIFRYFLQSERRFIRLADELEIVKSYLEIERLRLGPRLEIELDVDDAALPAHVPVLSIQPLVENAIKHGLAPKSGRGLLSVSAKVQGNDVLITVQDAGMGTSAPAGSKDYSGNGVGLSNVRRRLQLCFGTHTSMEMQTNLLGTRVQFAIPLQFECPVHVGSGAGIRGAGPPGPVVSTSGPLIPVP